MLLVELVFFNRVFVNSVPYFYIVNFVTLKTFLNDFSIRHLPLCIRDKQFNHSRTSKPRSINKIRPIRLIGSHQTCQSSLTRLRFRSNDLPLIPSRPPLIHNLNICFVLFTIATSALYLIIASVDSLRGLPTEWDYAISFLRSQVPPVTFP